MTDAVGTNFIQFVITSPNMQQSFMLDVNNALQFGSDVMDAAYEFGADDAKTRDGSRALAQEAQLNSNREE